MSIPTRSRSLSIGLHRYLPYPFVKRLPERSQSTLSFLLSLFQVGEPVLVLAGDENGLNRKWRKGYVFYEGSQVLTDWVCCTVAIRQSRVQVLQHINRILSTLSREYFAHIMSNIP